MPRRGRTRKKTRTHVVENNVAAATLSTNENDLKIPRSLVVRRGKVEQEVATLIQDLRVLMMPFTALNFQEDSRNKKLHQSLSHYAKELTGPLGLTHILTIGQSNPSKKLNLRLARTPSGPTMTFKIQQFSLAKDVRKIQKRPVDSNPSSAANLTVKPPVVVTNNFGNETAAPHVKLMRITFQNLFPAINVATVKLVDCKRVVLFNFIRRAVPPPSNNDKDKDTKLNVREEEDEEVEVRHYAIKTNAVGIDRKVRRIVQAKIPNLSKLDDISDFIMGTTASGAPAPTVGCGMASDSEQEDETSHVVLPTDALLLKHKRKKKGNDKESSSGLQHKSAMKLVEIGPRLRLKLTKVERGLANGDVMYHAYVTKDPLEVREQREKIQKQADLKRKRREEQEQNVRRKKEVKEEKRERKRRRAEERKNKMMEELRGESNMNGDESDVENEDE